MSDPLKTPKEQYRQTIEHISHPDSPVGIDAQLTHAIIIDYLQQLHQRLARIEKALNLPPWDND